jgi:Ca-activated chloride channel homolog
VSLQPVVGEVWIALATVVGLAVAGLGLMRAPRARQSRAWWWPRIIAVLALAVIALQPSVRMATGEERDAMVDVLLVVDRTGSMAAEDWGSEQPRLDGVRTDVGTLAQALPGVRWSVLSWDSEAIRQLPYTADSDAVLSWAQTMRQEVTDYSSGSRLDRPLAALTEVLVADQHRYPSNRRLVVLMSDGEQTTSGQVESFSGLEPLIDGGLVLGYGTVEGGQMRSYDGSLEVDPDAPWITGEDGEPAVSHLDEEALNTVAEELSVPYLHRSSADPTDLQNWVDGLALTADDLGSDPIESWSAVTWPAALLLVGALALELAWTVRLWPVHRREVR